MDIHENATIGYRHPDGNAHHYLETAIRSASPARLRLMLIERAIGVSDRLAADWSGDRQERSGEHFLMLLDLLNELLGGVTGRSTGEEHELCRQVADLYVFLIKHLVAAETNHDADAIREIQRILTIESETWRAVCSRTLSPDDPTRSAPGSAREGLDLEG